jgi:hypothetical protein
MPIGSGNAGRPAVPPRKLVWSSTAARRAWRADAKTHRASSPRSSRTSPSCELTTWRNRSANSCQASRRFVAALLCEPRVAADIHDQEGAERNPGWPGCSWWPLAGGCPERSLTPELTFGSTTYGCRGGIPVFQPSHWARLRAATLSVSAVISSSLSPPPPKARSEVRKRRGSCHARRAGVNQPEPGDRPFYRGASDNLSPATLAATTDRSSSARP